MNYEEMSDFRINKMVSDALGLETVRYPHAADKRSVGVKNSEIHFEWFDYCNNPSDAWPIIIENKINLFTPAPWDSSNWHALIELDDGEEVGFLHKNPLRAAMVVFLMMQEQGK